MASAASRCLGPAARSRVHCRGGWNPPLGDAHGTGGPPVVGSHGAGHVGVGGRA
jgi:hypothetical protein